jgi:ABC-2 type transport system ATP-binding protein
MAAIETVQLSKRYGTTLAVDGLTLTVAEGTVFGFLGPNGAGKSTTMRMLLGLVRPTAGHASLFGRDCRSLAAREAGLVGAMVEDPALYSYLSGRANLDLLCRLSGSGAEGIDWALRTVGLADVGEKPFGAYSHGMKQRLGIAAALLPRPKLLILDEPASGLDPAGLIEVRDLLRGLAADGTTVVLSSHLLFEVQQICTHVGLMFHGRLAAEGSVDGLLGAERTDLTIESDAPARVVEVLAAHGIDAEAVLDGTVHADAGRGQAPLLLAALVAAGVNVYALVPHVPTLEDLYLRYARLDPHG